MSGIVDDVLWVGGVADLEEGFDQGVLTMGFKGNVEIDCGPGGRVAQTFPVFRDAIPSMLQAHATPTWWVGGRDGAEPSGEDR